MQYIAFAAVLMASCASVGKAQPGTPQPNPDPIFWDMPCSFNLSESADIHAAIRYLSSLAKVPPLFIEQACGTVGANNAIFPLGIQVVIGGSTPSDRPNIYASYTILAPKAWERGLMSLYTTWQGQSSAVRQSVVRHELFHAFLRGTQRMQSAFPFIP